MYLRFETLKKCDSSDSREGVFQAAFSLRDSGNLLAYEQKELEKKLEWFNMHLESPDCLRDEGNHRGICWFHPRAEKPMALIRDICFLLNEYGIHTQMVKSRNPGTIIYEDGWQIVAKPRRKKSRKLNVIYWKC